MVESESPDTLEAAACLCSGFVPKDKRVDFMALRDNPKTGKPHWKCYLRYHKDCPEHGIHPDASRS